MELVVYLNKTEVGVITLLPNDNTIFTFSQSYIEMQDRPTLSLSFKDKLGGLTLNNRTYRMKLSPYFSNLLPEGHLRKYLAAQANIHEEREFFLLKELGDDLPGAVRVYGRDSKLDDKLEFQEDHVDQENKTNLTFSLAGVQLKFSAILSTSGGLTIPAKGVGGNWILKLPSYEFNNVPENEFSMMKLASWVGIEIPEIQLVNINKIENLPEFNFKNETKALSIKRFDRKVSGERVHIEDFAQVFSVFPEEKYKKASYKNISQVVLAEAGIKEFIKLLKQITYSILIGNADMHLKNLSLLYTKNNIKLSPAYDLVSTIEYIQDNKMALNLNKNKEFQRIDKLEFVSFARNLNISENIVLDTVKETSELFHNHWSQAQKELPISNKLKQVINTHLKTLPSIFYK